MGNLDTTNWLLGIMAAVSVLEALVLIGIGVGGFMVYRRVMQLVSDLETRQIAAAAYEGRRDSARREGGDGARQPADRAGGPRHLRHD